MCHPHEFGEHSHEMLIGHERSGETAGMDVALRYIMDELEGERPLDPKKRLAKVAGISNTP